MLAALACTKNRKYVALLNNAAKLSEGDKVTSAGLVIGKVRSISLQDSKAEVRFEVKEKHNLALKVDSCAHPVTKADIKDKVLDAMIGVSLSETTLVIQTGVSSENLKGPIPQCDLTNASALKSLQDVEIKIENYAIDVIKKGEKALNELLNEPH